MGWADLLFILGHPVRQPGGGRARRPAHGVRQGEVARPVAPSSPRSAGRSRTGTSRSTANGRPMRNSTVTTIAPTGHDLDDRRLLVGRRADLRAGLRASREAVGRRARADVRQRDVRADRARAGLLLATRSWQEIAKRGTLHGIPGVPERAPSVFKTSHEIALRVARPAPGRVPALHRQRRLEDHQPAERGHRRRRGARLSAGVGARAASGITVFRDGCKGEQVLNVGVGPRRTGASAVAAPIGPGRHQAAARTASTARPTGWRRRSGPRSSPSTRRRSGEPFEVFVQVGKGGSDTMAVAEALGRLISLILRLPSPLSPQRRLEEVISQLVPHRRRRSRSASARRRSCRCPTRWRATLAEHIGQIKPTDEAPPTAARAQASDRRSVQGVRPGDVRLRGRLQEVSVVRLQRVLIGRAERRGRRSPRRLPDRIRAPAPHVLESPACSRAEPTRKSRAGSGIS